MKVVITGGIGFLGLGIARELLKRGTIRIGGEQQVQDIVLLDSATPARRPDGLDAWVRLVDGDIADPAVVARLIDRDEICVFHLASVVSAGGERDFDAALKVNVDGARNVLEALRARKGMPRPRMVFASSVAVYGGELPEAVSDTTREAPATTYGMTKAIGELLVNDYSRKNFVDGRSARLPTVIVRPGPANAAASGFASAVFREPLAGHDYDLPVTPARRIMVIGARNAVAGLIGLMEAGADKLGADRAVALPNTAYSVAEMLDALDKVAAEKGITPGAVGSAPDAAIEAIVGSWPLAMDDARARSLKLPADESLEQIVRDYLEDFG